MARDGVGNQAVAIDTRLVKRLIATQFPHWSGLVIKPVRQGGWDNRTFHLGDHMIARLPSRAEYAQQVQKEQYWLPRLAARLPLPIPEPLAMGKPDEYYLWHWSVYAWLDGETAKRERIGNLTQFAFDLAGFLVALQKQDVTGGPVPGTHNFHRGGSLTIYDAQAREALAVLRGRIDVDTAAMVWDAALAATWDGPPVWFHGDIAFGNLLIRDGKLSAVIDFGTSGVGDPSCDLAIAWTLFEGESRQTFMMALPLDAATWTRGRGWTLWKALIVYAGLPGTNPLEKENARHVLEEVLADYGDSRKTV